MENVVFDGKPLQIKVTKLLTSKTFYSINKRYMYIINTSLKVLFRDLFIDATFFCWAVLYTAIIERLGSNADSVYAPRKRALHEPPSVRYAKRFYELYFQLIKNLPQVGEILSKERVVRKMRFFLRMSFFVVLLQQKLYKNSRVYE